MQAAVLVYQRQAVHRYDLAPREAGHESFQGNAVGGYCQKQCEERGLILRALGGNSVAICPPLIITEEQIDEGVAALDAALSWADEQI